MCNLNLHIHFVLWELSLLFICFVPPVYVLLPELSLQIHHGFLQVERPRIVLPIITCFIVDVLVFHLAHANVTSVEKMV